MIPLSPNGRWCCEPIRLVAPTGSSPHAGNATSDCTRIPKPFRFQRHITHQPTISRLERLPIRRPQRLHLPHPLHLRRTPRRHQRTPALRTSTSRQHRQLLLRKPLINNTRRKLRPQITRLRHQRPRIHPHTPRLPNSLRLRRSNLRFHNREHRRQHHHRQQAACQPQPKDTTTTRTSRTTITHRI